MPVIQFNQLPEEEKNLLYSAPALVAYLIGGADDNFDAKEEIRATHLVRIRTTNGDPLLFDFYKHIETNYFDQLDSIVKIYGQLSVEERTTKLVSELEKLNDILPKIDGLYARALIKSLKSLAKLVAESSSEMMGFLGVKYEEEHLMGLHMITYQP